MMDSNSSSDSAWNRQCLVIMDQGRRHILCISLFSTEIWLVGASQYLFRGALVFHHSARNFAVSEHDFLVKQNIMIGLFWEYLVIISGSLFTVITSWYDV